MLIFEQIRAGGDRNFGYLIGDRDGGVGVLIDPSYSPDVFVERAREQQLNITHIINTHGHEDHINGNTRAVELTGAAVAAHPACPVTVDTPISDSMELAVGPLRLQFLHVPGHAQDHVTVYEPKHQILLTGDLIFVGKVGGTKSDDDARVEWASLQRVVAAIPPAATVWPGHDYGARPSSTMGLERLTNPFLLAADVEGFLQMKRDWAAYKKRYGLR
jgi:glyoxylase-like metal-dependent hydrolase (beta-lactamase superfamily II)